MSKAGGGLENKNVCNMILPASCFREVAVNPLKMKGPFFGWLYFGRHSWNKSVDTRQGLNLPLKTSPLP